MFNFIIVISFRSKLFWMYKRFVLSLNTIYFRVNISLQLLFRFCSAMLLI